MKHDVRMFHRDVMFDHAIWFVTLHIVHSDYQLERFPQNLHCITQDYL